MKLYEYREEVRKAEASLIEKETTGKDRSNA
jgi:hypothetical protein